VIQISQNHNITQQNHFLSYPSARSVPPVSQDQQHTLLASFQKLLGAATTAKQLLDVAIASYATARNVVAGLNQQAQHNA
jgi:hypothetical protein